jgi:excisionase family DNA binding protein
MPNEKSDIEKALNRFSSIINNYPVMVQVMRQQNSINSLFNYLNAPVFEASEEDSPTEEEFWEHFHQYLKIFENIEKNLAKKVKSEHYRVPVYNFNADLIIEHSRKITSPKNQITYLQLVLEYYEPYLQMRYKEAEIAFLNIRESDFKKYQRVMILMIEKLKKEYDKSDFPFPFHLLTFQEKIYNEISAINVIDSDDDSVQVFDSINNPPGTKIKKKEETGLENETSNTLKEYAKTDDVMKMLGVGKTTIYNYMKSGKLKPRKVGRKNLFKISEVNDLIEGNKK